MSQEAPGCLGAIFRLFGMGGGGGQIASGPKMDVYRLRDDFLSPAEASFFRVLRLTVGDRLVICPKVRLGDLFFVARPNENRGASTRIASKHVDFVLCDPATLKPVAGLELDDSSHRKSASASRDQFKNDLFAAAGLPLIRVPVRPAYETGQVTALLAGVLSPEVTARIPEPAPQPVAPQVSSPAEPPVCPKCEVPMKLRTSHRGEKQGSQFWGCVNYPKCRHVVTPAAERD
jgi:hypothetical protein